MNWWERHIGDHAKFAGHLSMLEDGAYIRLLDLYYGREGPLWADIAEVCRKARATTRAAAWAVECVLREFFELEADGWHHAAADAAIAAYRKRVAAARTNGSLGGRPKKGGTDTIEPSKPKTPSVSTAEETQQVSVGFDSANPGQSSPTTIHHSPGSVSHETAAAAAPLQHQGEPMQTWRADSEAPPPAMTARDFVYLHGLQLLVDAGKGEGSARAYLGKLCKGHGEETTAAAIRLCLERNPIDPASYLAATLARMTTLGAASQQLPLGILQAVEAPRRERTTRERSILEDLTDSSWADGPGIFDHGHVIEG